LKSRFFCININFLDITGAVLYI